MNDAINITLLFDMQNANNELDTAMQGNDLDKIATANDKASESVLKYLKMKVG